MFRSSCCCIVFQNCILIYLCLNLFAKELKESLLIYCFLSQFRLETLNVIFVVLETRLRYTNHSGIESLPRCFSGNAGKFFSIGPRERKCLEMPLGPATSSGGVIFRFNPMEKNK